LAAQLWLIVSIGLFFLVGYLVLSELQISPSRPWLILMIGGGLCWYPLQAHLALGQLSLLVIACLIGCWILWSRNRNYLAGILLALACLIKLFPGLIFLYLIVRRKWHAFISALIFTLSGWLATIILIKPENVLHYFLEITPRLAAQQSIFPINVSVNGAVSRLFVDGPWIEPLFYAPHTARILWLTISLGLLTILAWQLWQLPQTYWADTVSYAMTCLVMLLLSPITWQHIFPLLILPFAILFRGSGQPSEKRSKHLALLLLCAILVSLPDIQIANMIMAVYHPYQMPWFISLLFLAPMVALFLLWRLLGRIEII
jgi:alpha-1,2-mannosyltransferase